MIRILTEVDTEFMEILPNITVPESRMTYNVRCVTMVIVPVFLAQQELGIRIVGSLEVDKVTTHDMPMRREVLHCIWALENVPLEIGYVELVREGLQ